jgi:hypothetical protein
LVNQRVALLGDDKRAGSINDDASRLFIFRQFQAKDVIGWKVILILDGAKERVYNGEKCKIKLPEIICHRNKRLLRL